MASGIFGGLREFVRTGVRPCYLTIQRVSP